MAKHKGNDKLLSAFVQMCADNCCFTCEPGTCVADIQYDYMSGCDAVTDCYDDIKKEFKKSYPCLEGKSFHEFLTETRRRKEYDDHQLVR